MCEFEDASVDISTDDVSVDIPATDDISADISDDSYDNSIDFEAEFNEPMEFEDIYDSSIFDDISDMSFEEQFEQQIENMSLDDLRVERENLAKMAELDDADIEQISGQIDSINQGKEQQDVFDAVTGDLSKEQLQELKEKVISKDKDVLDTLGYNNDTEDGGFQKVLRR